MTWPLINWTQSPYIWQSAFYLIDPRRTKWRVTVNTSGDLVTDPAIPSFTIPIFNAIHLKDTSNVVWSVRIDTTGHLVTDPNGILSAVLDKLFISDSANVCWHISILTNGDLVTT